MSLPRSIHRSSAALFACLILCAAPLACDDDKSADEGHSHGDHDEHSAEGTAGEHSHDASAMVGPVTGATCPSDNTLTYDNFTQKFVGDYCLRCHSEKVTGAARMMAPADHNFDTYADVDLLSSHMDELAGSGPSMTNTKMPPSDPKPTLEERQKFSQWVACGRPQHDP
jgi:hypothetical protein